MSIEVELLVAMADTLTDERVARIADAYRAAGLPHARFSVIAAQQAGRHSEACAAMRDMATSVSLIGLVNDCDPRDISLVVWAAKNAGYAMATEDLIGTFAYSSTEYGKLIDPWFAGFADDH